MEAKERWAKAEALEAALEEELKRQRAEERRGHSGPPWVPAMKSPQRSSTPPKKLDAFKESDELFFDKRRNRKLEELLA